MWGECVVRGGAKPWEGAHVFFPPAARGRARRPLRPPLYRAGYVRTHAPERLGPAGFFALRLPFAKAREARRTPPEYRSPGIRILRKRRTRWEDRRCRAPP